MRGSFFQSFFVIYAEATYSWGECEVNEWPATLIVDNINMDYWGVNFLSESFTAQHIDILDKKKSHLIINHIGQMASYVWMEIPNHILTFLTPEIIRTKSCGFIPFRNLTQESHDHKNSVE